jgi:hypothetical protein
LVGGRVVDDLPLVVAARVAAAVLGQVAELVRRLVDLAVVDLVTCAGFRRFNFLDIINWDYILPIFLKTLS